MLLKIASLGCEEPRGCPRLCGCETFYIKSVTFHRPSVVSSNFLDLNFFVNATFLKE